jgi:putative ABC transport system ATP-binding protein
MIRLNNLSKKYGHGDAITKALKNISLNIQKGEMIALMGPSGSGKSTLLNILGCLDSPSEGEYFLDDTLISSFSKKELAKIRNAKIGFVFQNFALMPEYTALENVGLPLIYRKNMSTKQRKQWAKNQLQAVGLSNHIEKKPTQLSGGQQQRVAIARALVGEPSIVMADEPTGSLDQKTGHEIMDIFKKIHKTGKTIVIVTHDPQVASYCERKIIIQDGEIIKDQKIDGVYESVTKVYSPFLTLEAP